VDVYAGGATGSEANPPIKIMEDVPCDDLPDVLAGLAKHGAFKAMRQQLRKIPQQTIVEKPAEKKPAPPLIRAEEIQEGAAKLVRVKSEEIAVFKHQGQLCAIENTCPHEGGQLAKGRIEGDEVVCPLHGYKFNVKTGVCSTDAKLKAKIFKLAAQGDGFTVEE
jgi:nitrite reductase/ring-hydroxylating ferredoxin subunit